MYSPKFRSVTFIILLATLITGVNSIAQSPKNFNIVDYGAVADGKTVNTKAIQKAIDMASVEGGKVIIPNGNFVSGSIDLKNNVELHLESDATLLGSTNINDYYKLSRWKSLILCEDKSNVKITGKGVIDGQGRELALNVDSLYHVGELSENRYNKRRKRPNENARAQIIEFVKCKNVLIENITIKDASSWVQTYDLCTDLKISGITVISDAYWNNDGIDISDCKNVEITNCYVNSADDGICLKSHHKDSYNENIVISDCVVRSSASAVKFGTASHGGFKNVKISNIKVFDTFRSAIAIESVDGGILEDIEVSNIRAVNTGNAIFIRLGHRNTDGEIGTLKNIKISDVKVEVPFHRPDVDYEIRGPDLAFFHNTFPASITGIPEKHVENVVIENIEITYPGRGNNGLAFLPVTRLDQVPENRADYPEFHMFGELPAWAFYVRHVDGLTLKNIYVIAKDQDYRPAFVFDNVKDLELEKIKVMEEVSNKKQIILNGVEKFKSDLYSNEYIRIIE